MTETEILNRGMVPEIRKMGHADKIILVDAVLNRTKVMALVGIVKNWFSTIAQKVDTFREYPPLLN